MSGPAAVRDPHADEDAQQVADTCADEERRAHRVSGLRDFMISIGARDRVVGDRRRKVSTESGMQDHQRLPFRLGVEVMYVWLGSLGESGVTPCLLLDDDTL